MHSAMCFSKIKREEEKMTEKERQLAEKDAEVSGLKCETGGMLGWAMVRGVGLVVRGMG